MPRRKSSPKVPLNKIGNTQAIRYRLHKAFPEVGKLFPSLSRRLQAGDAPVAAVRDLMASLPPQRVERLSLELTDVFSMGWAYGDQFNLVMGSIFGLDIDAATRWSGSSWQFIRELAELAAERRHSQTATDDRDENSRR